MQLKGIGNNFYQFLTIHGSSYFPPLPVRWMMVVVFSLLSGCICKALFIQIASINSSTLSALISSFCSFAYVAFLCSHYLRPHSTTLVNLSGTLLLFHSCAFCTFSSQWFWGGILWSVIFTKSHSNSFILIVDFLLICILL